MVESEDIVGVYLCLLALAGLQFVIAYQNIDASQMFSRMLVVAIVEAVLAVMFFMHLWAEKRGFLLVCSHLYDFCAADHAIWMDGQFSDAGRRTVCAKFGSTRGKHEDRETAPACWCFAVGH